MTFRWIFHSLWPLFLILSSQDICQNPAMVITASLLLMSICFSFSSFSFHAIVFPHSSFHPIFFSVSFACFGVCTFDSHTSHLLYLCVSVYLSLSMYFYPYLFFFSVSAFPYMCIVFTLGLSSSLESKTVYYTASSY